MTATAETRLVTGWRKHLSAWRDMDSRRRRFGFGVWADRCGVSCRQAALPGSVVGTMMHFPRVCGDTVHQAATTLVEITSADSKLRLTQRVPTSQTLCGIDTVLTTDMHASSGARRDYKRCDVCMDAVLEAAMADA